MTRRGLILGAIAALPALADASADVLDLLASMSAALAEGNAPGFAAGLSADLPARDELMRNVRALLEQAEVSSTIEPVTDDGDDANRTVVVDWSMQVKRRGDDLRIDNRRESVTIRFVRERKKWKVGAIDPVSLFNPPNFR